MQVRFLSGGLPVAVFPSIHQAKGLPPGLRTLGENMHWGSFVWGVVATIVCGGVVALLIGAAGSNDWFE